MPKNWTRFLLAKPPPAQPGEINYPLFDRFSFVHMAIGFGYGWVGATFPVSFLLAVAWELVENPLKANFPALFPHATADTFQNMVGDVISVSVGWALSWLVFH